MGKNEYYEAIGKLVIQYFGLRPGKDGLYHTEYGPKTEVGIGDSIHDFVNSSETHFLED
jgi:hypothetical protein